MSFFIVDVNKQEWDEWRPGVRTRNWSAETDGARALHIGEQIFEPGNGVPLHWHYYEEHLAVLSGQMELTVGDETKVVSAPFCVIFEPETVHSFYAVGDEPLHLMGAISSAIHETFFVDFPEGQSIRQYEKDVDNGARRRVQYDPETDTAQTVDQ